MRTSLKGIAEIIGHEGLVTSPYFDSVGVKTIGVGHTKSAGKPDPANFAMGDPQPVAKMIEIFRADLEKFEERVNKAVKVPLKQHQFDALVSFDFNTGGIFKAKLTEALNRGDYEEAARRFMGWVKPPEIKGRRTKEMSLFRTGQYGDGMATIYPADSQGRVQWAKGKRVKVTDLILGNGPVDDIPPPPDVPTPKPQTPAQPAPSGGLFAALLRIVAAILKAVFNRGH